MEKRPRLGGGGDADRISALPDEIIHSIIYTLDDPKQAARTSTLSRRWLHLWRSYPVLEFRDEGSYPSVAGYKKFARFAAASSRRLSLHHKNCRTVLDAFKLSLTKFPGSCPQYVRKGFDRLLAKAVGAKSGSPLEIVVATGWPHRFPAGLLSNCSRTKVLKLQGCDLNGLGGTTTISLHNLQVLHLTAVRITEQLLYDFVGNAANLQSFSMKICYGIERLEVTASNFPKLKTLFIHTVKSGLGGSDFELQLTTAPFLEKFTLTEGEKPCRLRTLSSLSAPNLKFVRILSFCSGEFAGGDLDDFTAKLPSLEILQIFPMGWACGLQMDPQLTSAPCLKTFMCMNIESPFAAPNLKVLTLIVPMEFWQSHIDSLISNLPCLESLSLRFSRGSSSSGMSKIRIWSRRLRALKLELRDETVQELEIDAPNLVSAYCGRDKLWFPGKITVVNVPYVCRFVVAIHDEPRSRTRLTDEWFLWLRHSFSTLCPLHLDMRLYGLDLSQQVSFDYRQAERSWPPLFIQLLRLDTALLQNPSSRDEDAPHRVTRYLQASWLEHPNVQNIVTLLDGLFWACRPKVICITRHCDLNVSLAELMYKQLENSNIPNCCVDATCWRHALKDVKMEFEYELCKHEFSPSAKKYLKISFMLKWF